MNAERRARICALNDQLRQHQKGGTVVATRGVTAQGPAFIIAVMGALARFDAFTADNDPYGERDFGMLDIDGDRVFWKIDYYDQSLTSAAVDPADEALCHRVLTLMLVEEY